MCPTDGSPSATDAVNGAVRPSSAGLGGGQLRASTPVPAPSSGAGTKGTDDPKTEIIYEVVRCTSKGVSRTKGRDGMRDGRCMMHRLCIRAQKMHVPI